MKMDVRGLGVAWLLSIAVIGCGKQKTPEGVFEKASDECAGAALSGQFMVRKTDGSFEVIQASSREEFIRGYLTQNLDRVEFAEHDFTVRAEVMPNKANAKWFDDDIPPADPTPNNWGVRRIHADALWKQNVRGEGVLVAVIDTGVDIQHAQLSPRIYTNPGESGQDAQGRDKASNGVDDDGNGYVDDVHGWNFVGDSRLKGDNQYHGTHVAGIIAADHQDDTAASQNYVQGVAPKVKILPLAFLDRTGAGALSDGVKAIRYAVAQGAKVINASWGGDQCSRALREEILALKSHDVAFVAASGNETRDVDTSPIYPGSFNLISQITVGAVGTTDLMTHFSNYGFHTVHLFAPGEGIISTFPGNHVAEESGTSMATPFVSGAVALLRGAEPTATVEQIRKALYASAAQNANYINASQGRLDLETALAELRRLLDK